MCVDNNISGLNWTHKWYVLLENNAYKFSENYIMMPFYFKLYLTSIEYE